MQGTHVTYTIHVPGTLAANLSIAFTLPFAAQLVHVSAVGSNSNNGILDIGNSGDADAYVGDLDIGDSGTPAECDAPGDFEGDNYPHIAAGTIVTAALDYDGAGGTATHDFTLVLTFTEG
ncbi:MAG: hypothetical protein WAV05_11880 [Anaerolineales bacterium]